MASLDVESLFTNIPLKETIDNIINDLFLTTDKVHNFQRKELKQVNAFAAYECFYIFHGEYYTQIDGVDIFVTLNLYSQLRKFVDYMNQQHPKIKLTFEVEKNNNFSFLDVKLCRENNKFTTFVFRKPTFSRVF